jgi:hypothetical protein
MSLTNIESLIMQCMKIVDSNNQSHIRLSANGGNSILLVCNPLEESKFVKSMQDMLDSQKYQIIDLDALLIQFVENNKNDLMEGFELLQGSLDQLFKLPDNEEGEDFFKLIIKSITNCFQAHKVPVLIRSGALYGTGIDNIHIMEHPQVMKSKYPVVILYPAIRKNDTLLFLGHRPSSKYRCYLIEQDSKDAR